jgi:BarA-like signal transduction histidine kinase
MNKNLDQIIQSLPSERQAKINRLAQKKIEEMLAHALAEKPAVRKSIRKKPKTAEQG